MEKFAVRPYNGAYSEFEISALFWGALIAIALVAVFLVAWKAIGWLRDRKEFHGVTTPDPEGPWGRAISRPSDDYFSGGLVGSNALGQLFDQYGWVACVVGIGLSLTVAATLAALFKPPR